ncbi:MAG: DNA/RNA helicase domain-containing protein, partial [Actinomycetes bacterium]
MPAGDSSSGVGAAAQIALEQEYVDLLYQRLDVVRTDVEHRLDQARVGPTAGTPGSRTERDALVSLHERRLATLNGVDDRLCFGRLDMLDGATRYVGRIGLADAANDPLLMDWRADAAAAFYQATAAQPGDVVRRRHIASSGRRVTGVDDDVLIIDALSDATRDSVTGHDALLTALDSARTGHMRDIVSTIQAEQDRIIRSDMRGVVVVQGGPGTGKTVVALHRVAYLLYARRDIIARSGALVIGPNSGFLSYIDRVLPALGETGVLMRTIGQLYPGIDTSTTDPPEVAVIKGNLRMADLLRTAVLARQRIPATTKQLTVDRNTVPLLPADVSASIRRARDSRKPHNEARVVFVKDLLNRLAERLAKTLHLEIDDDVRAHLVEDLRDSKDVRREVNLCWMPITPEQFLRRLFADPRALAGAGRWLTDSDTTSLTRESNSPWTISDIPLLDEAAELLGEHDQHSQSATAAAAAQRRRDIEYAREVLENSGAARRMMTAEQLADRYAEDEILAPVAERAAQERQWVFGHLVVDEAQELSAMEWRMLMRRCPSRSMTIVGDPAQTGSAAGVDSWSDALAPYVPNRWRLEQLNINYRTPAVIMELAVEVLRAGNLQDTPPRSVRLGKWAPVVVDLAAVGGPTLADLVAMERHIISAGTVAVVCDESDRMTAQDAIDSSETDDRAVEVNVYSVSEVKGLEFDAVILFNPSRIVTASLRPTQDLYVAITRPTQR